MSHLRKTLTTALAAALVGAALTAAASAANAPIAGWTKYMVRSTATGKIERFWVGVPPGLSGDAKYPAVYFLPGLLDGDDNWKNALEPYLPRHKVIAVCPSVGGATWFMDSPRQPWMKWGTYLREELRGFIEATYPVSRQKGQRGIAGISAGGHAAFYQALTHPHLYSSVTVLSGAMDLRAVAGQVGLEYWIGPRSLDTMGLYADRSCLVLASRHEGPLPFALSLEAGNEDGALPQMQAFRKILDTKALPYRWRLSPGRHEWTFWKTRVDEVLTWHADQFAHNRREGLYGAEADPVPVTLEVIEKPPEITLSNEAMRRLRAPWTEAPELKPVKTSGIPVNGAPLSKTDKRYAEAKIGRNGRQWTILTVPAAQLPVPAGEAHRTVEVHARLVVELKEPAPIRAGIVAAIQPFDAAGQPVGQPAVGTCQPGTSKLELWPISPMARTLWRLTLEGPTALPLAAIHEFRMEQE